MTQNQVVPKKTRILLVEDETMLRDAMTTYLNIDGFDCQSVGSLADFNAFLASGQTVDVVVFDLGLPDGDALDTVLVVRDHYPDVRIVIASARGAVHQRIEGLNKGADAYLQKPVDLAELSALLKSLAYRMQVKSDGSWSLDAKTWFLKAPSGAVMKLQLREKVMMEVVMAIKGSAVSRDAIIRAWGHNPASYDIRRMEAMVRRLRIRCQLETGSPLPLTTVYGHGYVFNQQQ